MAELDLWQFPYSHFCEKARWVLDYKRIPHRRRSVLPGFHIPTMRKLTGQQLVPVLFVDGQAVCDSAAITERVETDYPEPSLLPGDHADRDAALAWERRLGEELGPFIRRAWFGDLLQHRAYAIDVFSAGAAEKDARRFRRMYWLLHFAFKASMKVTKKHVAAAWKQTEAVFDDVARAVDGRDYLVGDSFTIADLTASALMSPLFPKDWRAWGEPEPAPPQLCEVADRYRDHPAMQWAEAIWQKHRGESAEI